MASDHPPATHEPDRPDQPPPSPPPPPDTGPEPPGPGMPPKPDNTEDGSEAAHDGAADADQPGGMIGEADFPTESAPDPGMLSEG